ncbi:MAG: acyl-CoA dehydrogenase family protein [Hyphomicrobium sp.]|nr:acyl-CoA dehydrogenase family protein [Hyphomicrobium sp.]
MNTFKLSPDLDEFRDEVRKTAERAFADKAAYWDRQEEFPHENHKILAELGYLGLLIPDEYGGSGAPLIQGALMVEELARVDFATALVAQIYLHTVANHIVVKGTAKQKSTYLPQLARGEIMMSISISEAHAGSAVTDLKTSATIDGNDVIINGSKCYFTAGHVVSHVLVFVRCGKCSGANGIGAVIVERGTPGFSAGPPHSKMGARAIGETDLFFDNCRVPRENVLVMGDPENSEGFKTLMSCFGTERVGSAAMSVGIAQGAFEYAKKFTEERHQFGRPIAEFQGLQWKIADMATQIHAARLMTYRAAQNVDQNGIPNSYETAMAKLYANEMVQRVTNDAMQICGHFGYTTDCPLERMYRDGRNFAYAAGTTEILRNTIAAMTYGRSFNQRRP